MKMACLGNELFQWFVDEVLSVQAPSDATLLLDKARELRQHLIHNGVAEETLPRVDRHWLFRWRKHYHVSIRSITTRWKVKFSTACQRVGVMLGNLFRLRVLWRLVFGPDLPMRFVSYDQKPSWFNNAGLKATYALEGTRVVTTKTDHEGTRQRYTIFTSVQSWSAPEGEFPKMAVLFKGTHRAPILRQGLEHPPWMKLQFQEKGSYRATDVAEFLEWALPTAAGPEESIVVLLDYFAAHLDAQVHEVIRGKGHVLLLHGGGVTGAEQINDTHLHALVQRLMEQLETRELYRQRREDPAKVAKLSRQAVLDVVAEMWRSINHEQIARDGYRQTGCLGSGLTHRPFRPGARPMTSEGEATGWAVLGGRGSGCGRGPGKGPAVGVGPGARCDRCSGQGSIPSVVMLGGLGTLSTSCHGFVVGGPIPV